MGTAARLNIPVFIHTADPGEFFKPLDYTTSDGSNLRSSPTAGGTSMPVAFETLNARSATASSRITRTRFIMAHFGWHANDLARPSRLLDAYPNVVLELAAMLYDIGRQPRAAHDFFVKYQDRILFGKDTFAPEEFPYYWRVFETRDEYFDYYRDYHAFWKLYGIDLPDTVLKDLLPERATSHAWPAYCP